MPTPQSKPISSPSTISILVELINYEQSDMVFLRTLNYAKEINLIRLRNLKPSDFHKKYHVNLLAGV